MRRILIRRENKALRVTVETPTCGHAKLYPSTAQHRVVLPTGKLIAQFVPDVREFERIRRMRNGVVHGVDVVDPADLHDAANRLHDIVEEVIRRTQENRPAPE
jgi:hypothetical protein